MLSGHGSATANETTGEDVKTSNRLTIGVSLPKSGRYARSAGVYYSRAYELWQKQINQRRGLLNRPVELVTYDDESQPAKAAENYKRLILEDRVELLLGPCHSALVDAVAPIVESNQRLLLQGSGSSHELFRKGRRYLFLCWSGCDFDYPRSFFEFRNRSAGVAPIKKAALVHTDWRIGNAVALGTRHYARSYGVEIVCTEVIGDPPVDYMGIMERVTASGPDAVLVALDHVRSDQPKHECVRNALAAGLLPQQIWLSDNPSPKDTELGEAINGVFMRGSWVWVAMDPLSRQFLADFSSAYGNDPEYHSAGGYACCQVLQQVVEATGGWDNEELRNSLLGMEFDTVMGKLRFAANGLPNASMQLCQWQDGSLQIVYPDSAKTRIAKMI